MYAYISVYVTYIRLSSGRRWYSRSALLLRFLINWKKIKRLATIINHDKRSPTPRDVSTLSSFFFSHVQCTCIYMLFTLISFCLLSLYNTPYFVYVKKWWKPEKIFCFIYNGFVLEVRTHSERSFVTINLRWIWAYNSLSAPQQSIKL